MKEKKTYMLTVLIIASSFVLSLLGEYWDRHYYHSSPERSLTPALTTAMKGLHDRLFLADLASIEAVFSIDNLSVLPAASFDDDGIPQDMSARSDIAPTLSVPSVMEQTIQDPAYAGKLAAGPETRAFTTASDDYFKDACFIGDSRTVGISKYSGIEGATFLCKTSMTIYDYDKPKLTYNDKKMSVKEILSEVQFAKIYLMVGINECGTGTPESFYEHYRDVVADIRSLQPDALIFIQGNLLVTQSRSENGDSITNENITARNALIATLADQRDVFYIDINESTLCADGALVADYTWDQVHIKAQFYPVWKDFLLHHAIVKT